MKRVLVRVFAVSMLVGAFALVSSAQSNNKRVQFAKGKTSAVEKFIIPANDGITYILRVKKGNHMKFTVSGLYADRTEAQGLTVSLNEMGYDAPLAEASAGEQVEHEFDSSGDYVITVMNPGPRRAKITLNVTINP